MTHRAPTETAPRPTQPLPPATVDRLADEIAALSSQIDAATHRLLTLIRRFDEGSGWSTHGALSCAHWLNWRIGLDLGAARERVRVARVLGSLPALDAALRRGAISYSKTRAVTRVATPANEGTLLEMAQHATASQLEKICRGYRRVLAVEQQDRPESLADEDLRRFVRFADTDDGMVRIDARLRPEEARVVLQALDVARRLAWRSSTTRPDVSAEPSPRATCDGDLAGHDGTQQTQGWTPCRTDGPPAPREPSPALSRADALVAVAEAFLSTSAAAHAARGNGAAPVEMVVHVDEAALRSGAAFHDASGRSDHGDHGDYDDGDADTDAADASARGSDVGTPDPTRRYAALDDGTALALATAQRLACDAAVVTVAHDAHGDVRTIGRRTRRISATLRRALRVRDDGCRFPGCTNRLTDAHHVVAWARGGATTLANLCSLCRRHHRFVHEHGYRIDASSDGELRFFRRDGTPVPAVGMDAPTTTKTPPRTDGTVAGHDDTDTDTDALDALRDAHAGRGLPAIDGDTAFPRWDGAPADYGLAVQALLASEVAVGPSPG